MINFRFHLVSLIAVFLAVGLGILVGSTVVDQKIVNRLDSEIKGVRKENSQRKAESKVLDDQNKQQQQFIELTAPYVADARLDNDSVAIVAERGVSDRDVKATEALLRGGGADVPGVLWLDDSWKLDTPKRTQDLETALHLNGATAVVRDRALDLFARRLAKVPAATRRPAHANSSRDRSDSSSTSSTAARTTTSAAGATKGADVLRTLESAGFVSVTDGNASDFDTFPAHVAHVLVITGDDSHFAGSDMTAALARSLTRANVPTVVAAVYDDGGSAASSAPKRGAALASILDDSVLTKSVSTVDDLDQLEGQVGAVLALEVVGTGDTGHYGYGTGASAPLPPHPS
jgi:hypothetical protein